MLTLSRWKIVLVTFSVIFGILFTLPNLLPQKTLDSFPGWLPKQKLNLGLDLQGGSYLMYEVDTQALRKERLKNLVEDVRTVLRNEQITFGELAEVDSYRLTDILVSGARLDAEQELLDAEGVAREVGEGLGRVQDLGEGVDELQRREGRVGHPLGHLRGGEAGPAAAAGEDGSGEGEVVRRRPQVFHCARHPLQGEVPDQ